MKRLLFVLLSLVVMVFAGGANAAILTVDVDGLDSILPDTIWSYQINFDVSGSFDWYASGSVVFNTTDQHLWEAAPGFFIPNWNLNSNLNLTTGQLVILADDKDFGDPARSPLINGTLFSVTYPDDVSLSLAFDSFLLSSDLTTPVDMFKIPSLAVFGAGEHKLTFSASPVPIPSALLLFGGGLLGLVGIRRKLKK